MNALINTNNNIQVGTFKSDLIHDYISFLDVSPRTLEAYEKNLKRFLEWMYSQGITQPQRCNVIEYRDYLLKDKAPATVQAYMVAVKLFFRWTGSTGIYPNIADNIKGAKVGRNHKKDHLTTSQVKAVLGAIDQETEAGKRDYAMLMLMFTGGLRTIEVSRAKLADLRTLGDNTVLYIQGKGRDEKDDYIKIPEATETAIRSYLSFKGIRDPEAYIFTSSSNNNKGQGITTRAIRATVKSRFKAVGLDSDRLTAHSTRHTAVTLALLAGSTVQEAQQFARHSDISTTMIYAHNLDKASNTCSSNIANLIE